VVLVEVTEVGEDEGADGFWLVLTSGPWDEATEGLVVLPLFEGSHLRAVDIEWEEPAARRSGSRSLGQHAPRAVVASWAAHDDAPVPAR
jgi:hypothetical protein